MLNDTIMDDVAESVKVEKAHGMRIIKWLSIHHPTGAAIYSSGVVCFAFRSGKTLKETQAILDEAIRITQ